MRYWHTNEFSGFFKDDWKVRSNLTLNLGVRYEWYGVVYDEHGLMAAPVGGTKGLFGISVRELRRLVSAGTVKRIFNRDGVCRQELTEPGQKNLQRRLE